MRTFEEYNKGVLNKTTQHFSYFFAERAWSDCTKEYIKEIKRLNEQIEKLKGCGSCNQYTHNCRVTFSSNSVCRKWEMRK